MRLNTYLRLAALFAVPVLMLGLLVACGDDDDDGDDDTPESTATSQPEATETPVDEPDDEPTATTEAEPTDTAEPEPGGPIEVIAQDFQFSPSRIEIAAGTEATVEFTNMDAGVSHSFHVQAGDVDVPSDIVTPDDGPATVTFTVETPGNYSFICDVHPTTMVGALVVS